MKTTWKRVPLTFGYSNVQVGERSLQEFLFKHPDTLPLGEIDPAYCTAIPICTELYTRAGPADALLLTPTGHIVLVEFKLWSNPEARREVIGQILDYARELASWSYDDLAREVTKRTERSPYDIVHQEHSGVDEHVFVDNVVRRLRRGEFLLLIIGDGIREGVERIVDYVQEHSGLRFNLALIEAAIFRSGDGMIIQPRVLAKTELLPRTILVRKTILDQTDDDPLEEMTDGPKPLEESNERFWTAVLKNFAFDDREVEEPSPTRYSSVWVKVEGSGFGGWALGFSAYLARSSKRLGVYLTWRKGNPAEERVYNEIMRELDDASDLAGQLEGYECWTGSHGRPRVGFRRDVEYIDGIELQDFDGAVKWMRDHFNRMVSSLHPECRRRLHGRK